MLGGAVVLAALVAGADAGAVGQVVGVTASPVEDQVQDQVQVQDQDQDQDQVGDQDQEAAALSAAPAGAPLADSVPVVLARRPWSDGGAIERLVEPSGEIVVHALSPAGTVLSCTPVGSLFRLPIESQTDAAGGEVVQLVRDDSGALVRFVVQADGEPRAVAVVEPAPAELSMH